MSTTMSRSGEGRRVQRHSSDLGTLYLIGMLALTLSQSGCYTLAAASPGHKVPGSRLAFGLTDRGRADLADQVGSGAVRIDGTLIQDSGPAYIVSISSVRSIDGATARWGGERIIIGRDQVANVFERKFSRSRTAIAAGVVVAGFTAFILTRDLNIFGLGRGDRGDKDPLPNL